MDRQGPPNRPCYQLTRGLNRGLDNEKDAMMSRCLDRRKYDAPPGEGKVGLAGQYGYIQGDFFCRLVGRSAPTGLAIVYWIGYLLIKI